jgi:hypothetical protein
VYKWWGVRWNWPGDVNPKEGNKIMNTMDADFISIDDKTMRSIRRGNGRPVQFRMRMTAPSGKKTWLQMQGSWEDETIHIESVLPR